MSNPKFLPAAAVCTRYGVTKMTLWRWLQHVDLGFPKPIQISKRNYWKLAELEGWEESKGGTDATAA